jgi:thioredoxin-related protein
MKFKISGFVILLLFFSTFIFINGSASSTGIEWHSYDDGMARGKFEKKKVFIHFTAAWCYYCGVMERETFKDPAIITSLNENFISIRVDFDKETNTSNLYGVKGLPDTIFIAENGSIIGRRPGYIPPDIMKVILNTILEKRAQD